MIRSMTGFGRAQDDIENFKITVEAVSLNSRFLDLHVYLPECIEHFENDIRKRVRDKISRGLVKIKVKVEKLPTYSEKLEINTDLLNSILENLKKNVKGKYTVDVAKLLDLPGVIKRQDAEKLEDSGKVMELVDRAIDEMIKSRETEGEKIRADIKAKLENLTKYLKQVEQLKEQEIERRKQKIRESFEELKEELGDDAQLDNRLSTELVYWANKLDVNEEISRIKAHIHNIDEILNNSKDPVGRKLDFYSQELHREITTLSNKSVDVDVIKYTILMREEVEKIKEQVRNVE